MNFTYIRDELLDKINKSIFKKEDVIKYVNDLVNNLDIYNYLKEIQFTHDIDDLSTYIFHSRILKVNLKAIIDDACNYYDRDNDDEKILFINIHIIMSLVHEVVHAYQNYFIHNSNNPLYNYMYEELLYFVNLDRDLYDDYYNCFSFEREAIVVSYEVALFILKSKIKNKALYDYLEYWLIDILLSGYEINKGKIFSPAETVANLMQMKIIFNKDYDLYTNLKYGFKVRKKDYNYFKNNSKKILRKKDLHQ